MAKRRSTHSPSTNRPPPSETGSPTPVQNLLLAALPAVDRERLLPAMDLMPLKLKDLLHKPGDHIRFVYFPGGGFCSIVTVLNDGGMVEVATIGREGAVGVTAVLDGTPPSSASMVQGASDTCYRMKADAFRSEMDRRGAFYELLTRYSQALVGFIMQSTACNAVHSIEQRLARWLLMAQDRISSAALPITHDFLATMLGTDRPSVSLAAGILQKKQIIEYSRGSVKILNRGKLEKTACECYAVIQQYSSELN